MNQILRLWLVEGDNKRRLLRSQQRSTSLEGQMISLHSLHKHLKTTATSFLAPCLSGLLLTAYCQKWWRSSAGHVAVNKLPPHLWQPSTNGVMVQWTPFCFIRSSPVSFEPNKEVGHFCQSLCGKFANFCLYWDTDFAPFHLIKLIESSLIKI